MRSNAPVASRRLVAAVSIAVAAGAALFVPVGAQATVAAECAVTDGDLSWGFKESFRSYISGSIANGEWAASDGATYATPNFSFTEATGPFDDETYAGDATFPGTIAFTGHDGLLRTSVANPTIAFASPASVQVLLDVSTVPMEQAMGGDDTVHTATQIPFVDVDMTDAEVARDGEVITITATDAPTAVTAEGFAAFGNYETGTSFDPLTFQLTITCASETPDPTLTAAAPVAEQAPSATPASDGPAGGLGTILFTIGGAVVLIAMAVATVLIRRSRVPRLDSTTGPADSDA